VLELTPLLNSVHTSNDSFQKRRVPLRVVTSIQSDCREHNEVTELTAILNSVHTSNDSLQGRRVQLSVVNSTESDCSEQGDMRGTDSDSEQCALVQRQFSETTRATQRGHQLRK
jgi:hypothetical protein